MLLDVGNLVKGISGPAADGTPAAKPLFSTSGPSSTAGLPKTKSKAKKTIDLSDDETNFDMLAPQPSPQKPAPRTVKEIILSEDEDYFNLASEEVPVKPAASATSFKATKSAPKAKKATPLKKAAAKPPTKATLPLTAKASAITQAKKKVTQNLDEDDVDAIANDILDSDKDVEMPDSTPRRAAMARPSRRAAAIKKKPIYLDSDSEDDVGEDEVSSEV